jgi:hypothetical protein
MRGGAPPEITYEEVEGWVKTGYARVRAGGQRTAELLVAAIMAEALRTLLLDPSTAQAANSLMTLVGSFLEVIFFGLRMGANVTTSTIGTIVTSAITITSDALSTLYSAASGVAQLCRTHPIVAASIGSAAFTGIALEHAYIRDSINFAQDNGMINAVTYALYYLLIRSGACVDRTFVNRRALPPPPADLEPFLDAVKANSEAVSQRNSAPATREGSQESQMSQISMHSDIAGPDLDMDYLHYAHELALDLHRDVERLLEEAGRKRARLDELWDSASQDAGSVSEYCASTSNKRGRFEPEPSSIEHEPSSMAAAPNVSRPSSPISSLGSIASAFAGRVKEALSPSSSSNNSVPPSPSPRTDSPPPEKGGTRRRSSAKPKKSTFKKGGAKPKKNTFKKGGAK